jgi:nucleoside permease NupC
MRYVNLLEYVDDEDIMRALPYAINSYFVKEGQSTKYIFYSNDMDIMENYDFIFDCLCPITFISAIYKIMVSKKYMYRFISTSESRLSKSMDFNDMIDYMDNNL